MILSIITINYNNASGLKKTMESVMAQTSKNFEYIVIDGGSTDHSLEIIKSFTSIPHGIYTPKTDKQLKPPITYWISEPDTGIYNAMNKGIRMAKGDYCQFLNSGDWLASPHVTIQMLENLPEKGILIGNMLKMMPGGKVLRDCGLGFAQPTFLTFYRGTLNHSPAYIRRDLFTRYGFYDENLRIVSDWKWYLQAVGLNNEQVTYFDKDVTCFEMTGISNVNNNQEMRERRKVLEELIPGPILADYDRFYSHMMQIQRMKNSKWLYGLFWFAERCLFKIEKWRLQHFGWKKQQD
ncbi:MAG: glycosyltransferase [Desulfobacteraceae bacterium]|jgi:glycosyltransferase involved in cell wall biosynthesis|nr:MAG: glycosyltransferase [Desulfobacteraceae bacterium]